MRLIDLLIKTNGDAAGVVLFTLLIYYFVYRHITTGLNYFETGLLISSTIALAVDIKITAAFING